MGDQLDMLKPWSGRIKMGDQVEPSLGRFWDQLDLFKPASGWLRDQL